MLKAIAPPSRSAGAPPPALNPALNIVGAPLLGGAVSGEAIGTLNACRLALTWHDARSERNGAAGKSGVTYKGVAAQLQKIDPIGERKQHSPTVPARRILGETRAHDGASAGVDGPAVFGGIVLREGAVGDIDVSLGGDGAADDGIVIRKGAVGDSGSDGGVDGAAGHGIVIRKGAVGDSGSDVGVDGAAIGGPVVREGAGGSGDGDGSLDGAAVVGFVVCESARGDGDLALREDCAARI